MAFRAIGLIPTTLKMLCTKVLTKNFSLSARYLITRLTPRIWQKKSTDFVCLTYDLSVMIMELREHSLVLLNVPTLLGIIFLI